MSDYFESDDSHHTVNDGDSLVPLNQSDHGLHNGEQSGDLLELQQISVHKSCVDSTAPEKGEDVGGVKKELEVGWLIVLLFSCGS